MAAIDSPPANLLASSRNLNSSTAMTKAFILSVNLNRRHMTAAQRAMATAFIYPDPEKGGRGKKNSSVSEGFSSTRLSMARAVLAHSPPIASAVLAGNKSLDEAYNEVRLSQGKITNETIRLAKLRETRPDLAEKVVAQEMTLDDAVTREKADHDTIKQRRWAATKNLIEGVQLLDRSAETVPDVAAQYDPAIADQLGETITPERLMRVAMFMGALAKHMDDARKAAKQEGTQP
jgi:hypothetical protein